MRWLLFIIIETHGGSPTNIQVPYQFGSEEWCTFSLLLQGKLH